jgi:hypothetical protein
MASKTTRKHTAGASSRRDRRRATKRRASDLSPSQASSHPFDIRFRAAAGLSRGAGSDPSAVPRRFRARLASARDRQRLGERNREERERVEQMLATVPVPVESTAEMPIEAAVAWSSPHELHPNGSPYSLQQDPQQELARESLQGWRPQGCPVCGGTQVACDEVIQLGTLRLSECLRCEHRWTERGPGRWAEVGARMNRSGRRRSGTQPNQA